MHRQDRSHLDEWATLLEVDVADELLEKESATWVAEDGAEAGVSNEEAR